MQLLSKLLESNGILRKILISTEQDEKDGTDKPTLQVSKDKRCQVLLKLW